MDFSEEQKEIVASEVRYLFEYAVFNLKDSQQKLCRGDSDACTTTGNVFTNEERVYSGSSDDRALNKDVQRFLDDFVDKKALDVFSDRYTVSGELRSLTTTLHGIGEINMPYERNAVPYAFKASFNSPEKFLRLIAANEIEHCQFDPVVAFFAFLELRQKAALPP